MKTQCCFIVLALYFCNCAVNTGNLNADNTASNSNTNIGSNHVNVTANESNAHLQEDRDNAKLEFNSRSFRVDIFENDKLISRCFFNEEQLQKEISYNTETNSEEFVTQYYYKKNGDFDRLKVTKGGESAVYDLFTRSMQDFEANRETLTSNTIKLPFAAEIITPEIDDLANIFSVAGNYDDFKKETTVKGNQKMIRFTGFNKRLDFKNSPMALVIRNNSMLVKDYELTLENGYPTKESLETDDGELTKTYSYKDGKLVDVVYQFTDLENRTNSLEKRFEYHKLS